jgi:hypothetical protein
MRRLFGKIEHPPSSMLVQARGGASKEEAAATLQSDWM